MAAQLDFTSKTTINADAGGWDPANARAMVYCSDLAYADPAHVDQTLTTWNLKLEKFLNVDDTQGFLASGDDGLGIVAFRVCRRGTRWARTTATVTGWCGSTSTATCTAIRSIGRRS